MSLLIDILIVLILLQVMFALKMHRLIENLEGLVASGFFLVGYHVILLDVVVY